MHASIHFCVTHLRDTNILGYSIHNNDHGETCCGFIVIIGSKATEGRLYAARTDKGVIETESGVFSSVGRSSSTRRTLEPFLLMPLEDEAEEEDEEFKL